jgi:hypothetical protein
MTDTTKQPGDSLPPSEPTGDIGTLDEYAVARDKILSDFEAFNATLQVPLSLHDFVGGRIVKLQAERDALAAQLAAVRAYAKALPAAQPVLSIADSATTNEFADGLGEYLWRSCLYRVRLALEAALKGEAK